MLQDDKLTVISWLEDFEVSAISVSEKSKLCVEETEKGLLTTFLRHVAEISPARGPSMSPLTSPSTTCIDSVLGLPKHVVEDGKPTPEKELPVQKCP